MSAQHNPERAAAAFAEAFGCSVKLLDVRPWRSELFNGHRILFETDADLPPDLSEIEVDSPSFVLVDVAQVMPRIGEACLVTRP